MLQTRAVLFTLLNPLLIWSVTAGAHNEGLTLVFAIVGLLFMRRSAFITGIFIGLAGAVKVSLVYYGLAMVWGYRHDGRKVVALGAGALIPIVLLYGLFSRRRCSRPPATPATSPAAPGRPGSARRWPG